MTESDLNTYRLQLQQVEAALTTDPDNEVGWGCQHSTHQKVVV